MTAGHDQRKTDLRAYALLGFTTLLWGGNSIAGRLAVGEISPMLLTSLRWSIACLALAAISHRRLAADWPLLRPRLGRIALMGMFGYTGFNAIFYLAAHYTGAVNISIIQGAIPAFVFLLAFLVYGQRVRTGQALGLGLTAIGVALVASKGALQTLTGLSFNFGDVMMLLACFFYGGYTLALRDRPNVSDIGFFTIMAAAALVTSLPLAIGEALTGHAQWPTAKGWWITLWIGIFPSMISQLCYMRGVSLIGPGRAGVFANLVPVFGASLAVGLLGEPFGWYHALGLVLVIGGIVWVQRA